MTIVVFVENRTSEDKSSKHSKLNGFVQAVPNTVDAESDIE